MTCLSADIFSWLSLWVPKHNPDHVRGNTQMWSLHGQSCHGSYSTRVGAKGAEKYVKQKKRWHLSCVMVVTRIWSVPQGLNPHCLSLCKCSPRFNLWRVQPDVLCNDVVWGMTRASRGSGSQATDALLWEGASGCARTWHRRCNVLSHCSSHVGAVKCGCGQPGLGSHTAVQLQRWEWQTRCIMLLNVLSTPGRAWYMTPHRHCSLWAWCCHCTAPWMEKK